MSAFTAVTEGDTADEAANAVMAAANAVWSREMIVALNSHAVVSGENPTTILEAVVDDRGDTYIATLTYSLRRNIN